MYIDSSLLPSKRSRGKGTQGLNNIYSRCRFQSHERSLRILIISFVREVLNQGLFRLKMTFYGLLRSEELGTSLLFEETTIDQVALNLTTKYPRETLVTKHRLQYK